MEKVTQAKYDSAARMYVQAVKERRRINASHWKQMMQELDRAAASEGEW